MKASPKEDEGGFKDEMEDALGVAAGLGLPRRIGATASARLGPAGGGGGLREAEGGDLDGARTSGGFSDADCGSMGLTFGLRGKLGTVSRLSNLGVTPLS